MPPASVLRNPLILRRVDWGGPMDLVIQWAPQSSLSFAASWIAPAGSAFDPPGREGTSLALGRLLSAGTLRRDKQALARDLDRLAAAISVDADWESVEVEVSGPASAWRELLGLLSEVIREPALRPEELRRVCREGQEALLRESTEPGPRAERVFLETVFPRGHPYHRNPLGTPRSLERLRPETVQRFHERHYTPRGSLLVVTTDRTETELLPVIRKMFGDWEGPPPPPPPPLPPPDRRERDPVYAPLEGTSQVEVIVGGPSPPRAHPDYPALFLADEVLGGRPLLSRLFQKVRERDALAYSTGSELEALRWSGIFTAEAGTSPSTAGRVAGILRDEIRRLAEERIPRDELQRIRESFLGSIPLSLETAVAAHGLATTVAAYDLPLDFHVTWPARIRSLSPSDIREAVASHWWPQGGPIVVASGPPKGAWKGTVGPSGP